MIRKGKCEESAPTRGKPRMVETTMACSPGRKTLGHFLGNSEDVVHNSEFLDVLSHCHTVLCVALNEMYPEDETLLLACCTTGLLVSIIIENSDVTQCDRRLRNSLR